MMTSQMHVPHGIHSQTRVLEQEGLTRVTQPTHALLEPGMTEAAHNLLSEGALLKVLAAPCTPSVDIWAQTK